MVVAEERGERGSRASQCPQAVLRVQTLEPFFERRFKMSRRDPDAPVVHLG
ncbi:hypothetical protein [Trinickia terrae]|uniref:hypothetical protein n=1 Tax=Trinickia terrae TaxID=2571161 RepID=UPI00146A22AE|nr:hypothetical protein [Trinickia terrae]